MTVFKRANKPNYEYDFQLGGRRYSGTTGTIDYDEAVEFEGRVRADVDGQSIFARSILKRARRQLPIRQTARGFVYVLQSGYFIKIGYSNDPNVRIRSILTSTPDECELVFVIPGGIDLERRLHREFAASHYRREWFFLCGKLKHFIAEFRKADPETKSPEGTPENGTADLISM